MVCSWRGCSNSVGYGAKGAGVCDGVCSGTVSRGGAGCGGNGAKLDMPERNACRQEIGTADARGCTQIRQRSGGKDSYPEARRVADGPRAARKTTIHFVGLCAAICRILACRGASRTHAARRSVLAAKQARLKANQQQMALMHADRPEAAIQVPGSNRKPGFAALPRHPRSIRVHPRHLLLISVESCLLWRMMQDCARARQAASRAPA